MKLTEWKSGAGNAAAAAAEWCGAGYETPQYDRDALKERTLAAPEWLHFGAGNIFRAFPAADLEKLIDQGAYDKGVIVAESFDYDIIRQAYRPYDNLSLLVVLRSDATIDKRVIGSVTHSYESNPDCAEDVAAISRIMEAPSLRMVSFTVTEKGYAVPKNEKGEHAPFIAADMECDPNANVPKTAMAQLTMYLYRRFLAGAAPLALVSMDNCSHNGDKLKAAVSAFAEGWRERGYVGADFLAYLNDETKITFPLSMIDKITPRPDAAVQALLEADGFEDTRLIVTDRNTYTAPFVNAEETQYLVIEDKFPNGRIPLDLAGVIYTDRETVDQVEKMKVCTCLNPLHTALAVFGCLLGHTSIYEEMEDAPLCRLVTRLGYEEGMPVVTDPGVLSPEAFIDAVLTQRLVNPFMPDTPQRIATDTSQKLAIRFGETLKAYTAQGRDLNELTFIPLVLAGYCRYLQAVDDSGAPFAPSADPQLAALMALVAADDLHTLLQRGDIFGLDLCAAGLEEKITAMYREMSAGAGAVRDTLVKYTNG